LPAPPVASQPDTADIAHRILLVVVERDPSDRQPHPELKTTGDKARQDQILQCFDAAICERFGSSLSAISDSDLMETLLGCE
jgi:hypothetical protein